MNQLALPERVFGAAPELVAGLLTLQQAAFPPHMQYQDAAAYYRSALADPANFNLVLRGEDRRICGYILGIPQPDAASDLAPWDPAMQGAPDNLYIDIIQTLPGRRRITGVTALLDGVCQAAWAQGYRRLSAHVRTTTGLSPFIQKILVDCRRLRRLDDWFGSGESFDYLESEASLRLRKGRNG